MSIEDSYFWREDMRENPQVGDCCQCQNEYGYLNEVDFGYSLSGSRVLVSMHLCNSCAKKINEIDGEV